MKKPAGIRKTGKAMTEGAASPAPPALPTREDILAFIAREREALGEKTPSKIGKREIARAFGIRGSDKIGLKRVLKELEEEGAI